MGDKEKNDNVLRTKILVEINEDFHQGDKLNFALDSSDILRELVSCFDESDETIRELASRAIIKVACSHDGRQFLIDGPPDGEELEIVPKIR